LGGQAVAELDENGAKRTGIIYANGMKVANYSLVTYPSPHWVTLWCCTDPVTGGFATNGTPGEYVFPSQLDPLGADVTRPPEPLQQFEEPAYLNPHKDIFWPIEYTGGQTGELEIGMAEWEQRLQNTRDTIAARDAARRNDLITALLIMERNPNVGIQASGPGGSVTLWGRETAKNDTDPIRLAAGA